jgi:hypothetical protein
VFDDDFPSAGNAKEKDVVRVLNDLAGRKYLCKINCALLAAWEQGAGSREKGI